MTLLVELLDKVSPSSLGSPLINNTSSSSSTPPLPQSNCCAAGPRGDLFILGGGGQLFYCGSTDGDYNMRQVTAPEGNFAAYHSIEYVSEYGDPKALLWGDRSVMLLTLPSSNWMAVAAVGEAARASVKLLARDYFATMGAAGQTIVHCKCHPSSPQHVVVLLAQGPLLIINTVIAPDSTSNSTNNSSSSLALEVFPLDVGSSYRSFSFGQEFGWLRWTIFLLSSEGHVSVLCPVVPHGVFVSEEARAELDDYLQNIRSGGGGRGGIEIAAEREYVAAVSRLCSPLSTVSGASPALSPLPRRLHLAVTGSATDLAVLPLDGLQVPLLALVTADGSLYVHALSGDVHPAWRGAHLSPAPLPETVLVERLVVCDAVSGEEAPAAAARVRAERCWSLVPDPLLRTSVHVVGRQSCAAFLVSLDWVTLLAPHYDQPATAAAPHSQQQIRANQASSCVPVFMHEASSSAAVSLSGFAVLADPFIGHFGLFRTSLGASGMVNLTVHARLCQLQYKLLDAKQQLAAGRVEGDGSHWEALNGLTDRLLAQTLKGVSATPTRATTVRDSGGDCGGDGDEEELRLLTRAMAHLEQHAVRPLEEAQQRLQFRFELSRETLAAQRLVLEGEQGGRRGLRLAVVEAGARQARGRARLERLLEVFARQKELTACVLTQALVLKSRVSAQEERLRGELEDMRAAVGGLETTLEGLRQQARALRLAQSAAQARGTPQSPSSPYAHLVTPAKTPARQAEWFQRRRIGAMGAQASALSAVGANSSMLLLQPPQTPLRTPFKEAVTPRTTLPVRFSTDELDNMKRQLQIQTDLIAESTETLANLEEALEEPQERSRTRE